MSPRPVAFRGALSGLVAGLALAAGMYLAGLGAGLRPLPQLLQEPLLAAMPGPVFGFLIDNLQHAGKVLEELGLLVALLAALSALGAAHALVQLRWPIPHLALGTAAAGWAVVAGILLPVSGDGFLGLGEGLTAPLLWAVLFAVYAFVLELALGSAAALPAELPAGGLGGGPPGQVSRRHFLGTAPIAVGGISLLFLGFRLIPGWYTSIARPPEAGLAGPVPELTPVENFYVVSKNFQDPAVSAAGWALKVGGSAAAPYQLSLDQLRSLPSSTQAMTLECISNNVGGALISTGRFTGIPLRDLVQRAQPRAEASAVNFKARDGFTESLPLSLVMGAPEILVAYDLDGAPLATGHGFPARVLIPGHYGMKGPKWLDEIDLAAQEAGGYWEQQGWDRQAIVKTMARIDSARDGDILRSGSVTIAGVAFAGTRGISTVELSTDGGGTWAQAQLRPPLGPLTWTLWTFGWLPAREGAYTLQVRARDGSGDLQTAARAPSFPSGASGYHTVHVNVGK